MADKLDIELTKGSFKTEDGDKYIGYGFSVYRGGKLVYSVPDLTDSEEAVTRLISLLKDNDVELIHFSDIVDDFLGTAE